MPEPDVSLQDVFQYLKVTSQESLMHLIWASTVLEAKFRAGWDTSNKAS